MLFRSEVGDGALWIGSMKMPFKKYVYMWIGSMKIPLKMCIYMWIGSMKMPFKKCVYMRIGGMKMFFKRMCVYTCTWVYIIKCLSQKYMHVYRYVS